MKRTLAAFSLLSVLSLATPALADKPAPAPVPPTIRAPLVVQYDKGAKEDKILIPKKFLEGVKLGQLELESGEVSLAGSHGRTVLAGLAFSMAIGSVVVFRRGRMPAAMLMVTSAMALGATLSWADVPIPPVKSTVVIEVVEHGDAVTIIHPARR